MADSLINPQLSESVDRRAFGAAFAMLVLSACAPLRGASRTASGDTEREVVDSLACARFGLLGELHDNPALHRLRLGWLQCLSAHRRFAIAMEQFDVAMEPQLAAARTAIRTRRARDPELALSTLARELAEAGGFSFSGWEWPLYEPVLELALRRDLPLVAANLSAGEAAAIARAGQGPAESDYRPSGWTVLDQATMAAAIREGHCGLLPESALPAMVRAQLARDRTMAIAMCKAARDTGLPVVLLAGNGHVRADIGVPRHLRDLEPDARIVAIAIGEQGARPGGSFDRIVATVEPVVREDPCESLRQRFSKHRPGPG
jgi:uncharacterized iron-regulated protein